MEEDTKVRILLKELANLWYLESLILLARKKLKGTLENKTKFILLKLNSTLIFFPMLLLSFHSILLFYIWKEKLEWLK